MQKIRYGLIVLWILVCSVTPAESQVSIGIGTPHVSIGINLPLYPELVRVPGYPVYYAPRLNANYFFYDGMYWVYQYDNWYASSWYNGPWWLVEPAVVPLFILRVPVRYYRQPPVYFHGWRSNAPPRWGQHWGHEWEQHRRGWDRWNRGSAPAPAPLPVYQRQYTGDRYPRQVERQQTLRSKNYRYQPRDAVVRQHFQQQDTRRPRPPRQGAPAVQRSQPTQRDGENIQRSAPAQTAPHQRAPVVQEQQRSPQVKEQKQHRAPAAREQRQQPGAAQHGQQEPKMKEQGQGQQDRGKSQEPARGHGQGQKKDEERGRDRNN